VVSFRRNVVLSHFVTPAWYRNVWHQLFELIATGVTLSDRLTAGCVAAVAMVAVKINIKFAQQVELEDPAACLEGI
jgi:hypothetical protein